MFGETQPIPRDEMDNNHPARTIPGDRPDDFLPEDNFTEDEIDAMIRQTGLERGDAIYELRKMRTGDVEE